MNIAPSFDTLFTSAAAKAGENSLASGASSTSGDISFKEIMSLMMSTSMSSSLNGGGGAGMDMFAPLLLVMFEKLMQLQLDSQKSETSAASDTSATADPAGFEALSGYGSARPNGRPVGGYVTQSFNAPQHNGIDFGVGIDTPIRATMDGKVVYAGWNNEGYGNLVIVENGPYRTFYAHLNSIPVSYGQEVKGGSLVGYSGTTGNSTGPHLHYEVRYEGRVIDPTSFTLQ